MTALKFKLRPYQEEAHAAVFDGLVAGYQSVLATAATGTGKTQIFTAVIRTLLDTYKWKVLVLAPGRDLIFQAYNRIASELNLAEKHNGVGTPDIDIEMADDRMDSRAKVIVGTIQTCYQENRLAGWTPDAIVVDEADLSMSASYDKLFARFPDAVKIGFTATPYRGDNKPVFFEGLGGVILQQETKRGVFIDVKEGECGFSKHVFDYPLPTAIGDGYLIEPRGYSYHSGVDISHVQSRVSTTGDRDFSQQGLNDALTKDQKIIVDRINGAIGRWDTVASDRSTIAFCPSVQYAHWAADLWRQAGFTAVAVDGTMDKNSRDKNIQAVRAGDIQVACNYGVYARGTDVDRWSCEVLLRPTESPSLYSQWIGRVTRPLDWVAHKLNDLDTADERLALIAGSAKPDSIIIDTVDIVGKHKLATLPTTLGLPANLDLQGRKLTDAAKLVKEFEDQKKQVLYECPATYEELEARLKEIAILTKTGAKHRDKWMVAPDGSYSFGKAAPGYHAKLTRKGAQWALQVQCRGEVIFDKLAASRGEVKEYFDKAAEVAMDVIGTHRREHPNRSNGTIEWLKTWKNGSGKYAMRDLRDAGFSDEQIDALSKKAVFPILDKIRAGRKVAHA